MKRIAVLLLVVFAIGCGGTEQVGGADAGVDAAAAPPPPQETRAVSSASGRLTGGTIVFDVEVGVGISRGPSSNWQSSSPTVP